MPKIICCVHAIEDFAASTANFYDWHKTKILWGIFALLPAGIGLLALSVKLNSTSGWFFWPAFIMIIAGGEVGLVFMAKVHTDQLRRGQDRRYERNKRQTSGSW